jgi:UDP-2,3-diacylglucosamine hydrolase
VPTRSDAAPVLPGPTYLLSDVHLGVAPKATERALIAFLRSLPGRAGALVINGDLFDFWFEWRSAIPRTGFRVVAALADLVDAGVPVTWIAGNHDCWGGDVLREDVGVTYHFGPWIGTLAGWRARVEHGDGLRGRADRGYRAIRPILRHPFSKAAFRLLPADVGSRLATGSSQASRTYRPVDDGLELRRVGVAALTAEPALELFVLAHSHVAGLERAATGGIYANAGSWLDAPTYLRVDAGGIALHRWTGDGSAEGDRLDALERRAEEALRHA